MSNRLYHVELTRSVLKYLEQLDKSVRGLLVAEMMALASNPRPKGAKKLVGKSGYRIRCRDYRIIYEVLDDKVVVLIVKVGHRKDIYK